MTHFLFEISLISSASIPYAYDEVDRVNQVVRYVGVVFSQRTVVPDFSMPSFSYSLKQSRLDSTNIIRDSTAATADRAEIQLGIL